MQFPIAPEMLFLYAGVVALALFVVLAIAVIILSRRLTTLTQGKNGADLETTIASIAKRTKDIESFRAELEEYLYRAETRIRQSVQGVATVRFNPFEGDGMGGNQSFATAFVDEDGNGVVISTLYARERMSVFGKPLIKGDSRYELSEEEREAVRQASLNLKVEKRS